MEEKLKEIVKKIKQKKELAGISDSIVEESIIRHIQKSDLFKLKSSEIKILVKLVRAELRKYSGQFQINFKDRLKMLKENRIEDLLKTHVSTQERFDFYPELKKIISGLNIHSILDLACGLNPLALAELGVKYYASDIKEDELEIIEEYFRARDIDGKVFVYDIRKIKDLPLPKADLGLVLKVLDIIEKKSHKLSEEVIKQVDVKYLLLSFPTKKLSGKPMRHPQRRWVENLLMRLGYNFKVFESKNEIFYLIKKL